MGDFFALKNTTADAVMDVPYSDAAEMAKVELYPDFHGGENQLWQWEDKR